MLSPIIRNVKLNYQQLDDILQQFGYTSFKAPGGHTVYKHRRCNSLLAVRKARKNQIVPDIVVVGIMRSVWYANVASEAKIRRVTGSC